MSDRCPSGRTGKSAVRDQRNTGSKSHARNRRSGIQHFTHTRSTLRSFIADDDYIACHDLSALNSRYGILLTLKYSGRSLMHHHLFHHSGTFHHAAVGCQIAFQHSQSACTAVRMIHSSDHFRIPVYCILDILTDRLSRHGHAVRMQKSDIRQFLHHRIYTSGLIQIFHISRTCRSKMAQIRRFLTDLIGIGNIKIKSDLMRNSR